ncbi:zinc-dependent metalloprotease [Puerhibacterium sp. TATVAM-FAB25]|uniref:zinc-dependent metalloprotease n=1 Tax=Puerhibacterium sp. TATVAM-FAB25 TaxID=3093699 RepID=UPI00397B0182
MNSTPDPVVDWSAAAGIAAHVAPPGPRATREQIAELVEGLRHAAARAVPHVLRTTRLEPAGGVRHVVGGAQDGAPLLGQVAVVDRATWARANTQVMEAMTAPVAATLGEESVPTSDAARLGGAAEVGGLLALLSSRVLGQFDPYSALGTDADAAGPGRLLLVAPNVLQVERALDVHPADFRLWVCLHEQTHALQFAAAPWLAGHLRDRVGTLLQDLARTSIGFSRAPLRRKLAAAGRATYDVVAGVVRGDGPAPLDRLMTPAQKDELVEVTAVMALLEGHADVMMDAVGPRVVRSVRTIRARFDRRRAGEGAPTFDVVLRRLLGMEAKLAQYRDGAQFVRAVEEIVGRDGLNAAFAAPENLPSAREIADAPAWVRRVHG